MFSEKPKHWNTGPFKNYIFSFDSWEQWIDHRPYTNLSWGPYEILKWNIKEESNKYMLQIIYGKKDGELDIKAVHISVKHSDEQLIHHWLLEHYFSHRVC
jgi:hypothetical protein